MYSSVQGIGFDPIMFTTKMDKQEKSTRVAAEFESLFLYQLMKDMDKTVERDEEGILNSSNEETYRSMFHQELTRHLAASGGIGLQDVIGQQLMREQGDVE